MLESRFTGQGSWSWVLGLQEESSKSHLSSLDITQSVKSLAEMGVPLVGKV